MKILYILLLTLIFSCTVITPEATYYDYYGYNPNPKIIVVEPYYQLYPFYIPDHRPHYRPPVYRAPIIIHKDNDRKNRDFGPTRPIVAKPNNQNAEKKSFTGPNRKK